jgi:sulfate permease, SulP family
MARMRYLILDFHRVSALDSSAVLSFTRLFQLAETNHIHLVVTELKPVIQKRLEQGGLIEGENTYYMVFPSLDYGMEWCEKQILAEDSRSLIMKAASLQGQLKKVFGTPEQVERFMKYLERQEFDKGHALIKQGDPPESMYFVDAGRVSAQLEVEDGHLVRLKSMGGGTVVGEIGLYLDQIRTATIVTDTHSVVYCLRATALKQMEQNDPDLASTLHHWMARMLAERLSDNNRTLEALLN